MSADATTISPMAGGGIRTRDLLITKQSRLPGSDAPSSQNGLGQVKKQPQRSRPAHNGMWLLLVLAALALVTCKGQGCTPGDYITTCRDACAGAGVRVVLPSQSVCVCGEATR